MSAPGSAAPVAGAPSGGFLSRLVRRRTCPVRQAAQRATAVPMVVRGAVFGTAVAALGLGLPTVLVLGRGLPLVLGGALLVTLAPRGRFVTLVLLSAAFGWVLGTIAFDDRVTAGRLAALAGAMYLLHTTAALAAVLPYDAVVAPSVLVWWLVRAAAIVAVSAAVAVFGLAGTESFADHTYLLASLVGVVVAGALVWLLIRPVRR